MAAHFVKQRRPKDIFPAPHIEVETPSIINSHTPIRHLDRPHANGDEAHATTGEMTVMVLALGVMVALIAWLGWILLDNCVRFVQERTEQQRIGGDRRDKDSKTFGKIGSDIGRGLRSTIYGTDKAGNRDEEIGRRSEVSGLLRDAGGLLKGYGNRGDRSVDGASDSASSGRTTVLHREDCENQCGQPRRRSGD